MTTVPKSAPHIQSQCSLWNSFSFTAKVPSEETVHIGEFPKGIYNLSYYRNKTIQRAYEVTSSSVGNYMNWTVTALLDIPQKKWEIKDDHHWMSLTLVPQRLKVAEALAVLGILFSAAFAGSEIHHRRYFPRAVPLIGCGLLLVVCLIFSRNVFRKRYALMNALKLMMVVEHARMNNSSIEDGSLAYSPYADYKR
jgi:hypothetical protein